MAFDDIYANEISFPKLLHFLEGLATHRSTDNCNFIEERQVTTPVVASAKV
ncbi:hypothetical protein KKP04_02675 [Rhodomicrobium sp. Az07]|uniref:hypothetical protein n=1 Tax=Rhodomicrobium sp. Az07 TaxID=2839034 RepID=UPI001BEB29C6|nr:hypothetical protein [Rhodomicrobium sp. Az07]MBT3069771.1 hypothetical protein [Rhodomicrobium sp. Az07]